MKQRSRILKPEFFQNRELAEEKPHVRLLYEGLWTLADREGLLLDIPELIKGFIFPFEKANVDDMLQKLADKGFIGRFECEKIKYIYIPTFLDHQKPHPHEAQSVIACNLMSLQCNYKDLQCNVMVGGCSVNSISSSISNSIIVSDSVEPPPQQKVVKWEETKNERFLEAWEDFNGSDYEAKGLSIATEFTKAKNWVANNPYKKDYKRFITNWLNTELTRRNDNESKPKRSY